MKGLMQLSKLDTDLTAAPTLVSSASQTLMRNQSNVYGAGLYYSLSY